MFLLAAGVTPHLQPQSSWSSHSGHARCLLQAACQAPQGETACLSHCAPSSCLITLQWQKGSGAFSPLFSPFHRSAAVHFPLVHLGGRSPPFSTLPLFSYHKQRRIIHGFQGLVHQASRNILLCGFYSKRIFVSKQALRNWLSSFAVGDSLLPSLLLQIQFLLSVYCPRSKGTKKASRMYLGVF